MSEQTYDKKAVVDLLNEILETELAGVVRYTHYSLMVFGHSRIPIVSWLRGEATTCLEHANQAGEMVTHLGEHPSLKIGALLETQKHGINDILLESLDAEKTGLTLYKKLLDLVRDPIKAQLECSIPSLPLRVLTRGARRLLSRMRLGSIS